MNNDVYKLFSIYFIYLNVLEYFRKIYIFTDISKCKIPIYIWYWLLHEYLV